MDELGQVAAIPPLEAAQYLRLQSLQTAQPHRTLLETPQALPLLQHTIRQNHGSLALHHHTRLGLDDAPVICGYALGQCDATDADLRRVLEKFQWRPYVHDSILPARGLSVRSSAIPEVLAALL
jgi:hypothetical protein